MRKIVQIIPVLEGAGVGTFASALVAICEDNTVWAIRDTAGWKRLPDIPQEGEVEA